MTSLDVWMLICMVFVAAAQFEYAIQLKIRFGKMAKIGTNVDQERKARKEEKCRKIDIHALKIFLLAYMLIVGGYFYNMSIKV